MGTDPYYKLWLRNDADTGWTEVDTFINLKWRSALNSPDVFECLAFEGSSSATTSALFKAGRAFRLTKSNSTTGNDGTLVFGGRLLEPESDEKSTDASLSMPYAWHLKGIDYFGVFSQYTYDLTTSFPPKTSDAAVATSSVVDDVIDQLLAHSPADQVSKGTFDTGESVRLYFKNEKAINILLDIAAMGDSQTSRGRPYTYYIVIEDDYPNAKVNYYSPQNAVFTTTHPFGTTQADWTGSPSGSADNARIIDLDSQAINFDVKDDTDRVVNSVYVQYGGFGSGVVRTKTSAAATDSTSITANGKREVVANAPYITDETTANFLKNTIKNMYKGNGASGSGVIMSGKNGIVMVQAELIDGEFRNASGFNGKPGDIIGFKRNGSELCRGRMSGVAYSQDTGTLTVIAGIPNFGGEGVSPREYKRITAGMDRTKTIYDGGDNSNVGGSQSVAANSSTTKTLTLGTDYDSDLHDGIALQIKVAINDAGAETTEEHLFRVEGRLHSSSPSSSTKTLFSTWIKTDREAPDDDDGLVITTYVPTNLLRSTEMFNTGSRLVVDQLSVIIENRDGTTAIGFLYNLSATPMPAPSV